MALRRPPPQLVVAVRHGGAVGRHDEGGILGLCHRVAGDVEAGQVDLVRGELAVEDFALVGRVQVAHPGVGAPHPEWSGRDVDELLAVEEEPVG